MGMTPGSGRASGTRLIRCGKADGGSFECMTVAKDGELSMCMSSPPPLAEDVVRAMTEFSRAVGVEPPWISKS
jgi:hypothetical protein